MAGLFSLLTAPAVMGDILIYASADMGSSQPGGTGLLPGQFIGARFQLGSTTTIDAIGGNMSDYTSIGDGRLFGALIQLTSLSDFPDSTDLSTPDVLAHADFTGDYPSSDLKVPISPLTLGSGTYAVLFGSGLFGVSGNGAMAIGNPPNGSFGVFGLFGTTWENYGSDSGMRLTVYAVPEPALIPLLAVAFLAAFHVRRLPASPGNKAASNRAIL